MLRTHTCGELRISDAGQKTTLCGWVHYIREFGGMTFIDLRDRFGRTQLVFGENIDAELAQRAVDLGREYVIRVTGKVVERENKNPDLPTGEVEVIVEELELLNDSKTPPFTIEDETDGGEELRMKYRWLDLRRPVMRERILLRHRVLQATRNYLSSKNFTEIETPNLIKSTPEGARDFVVPSRLHPGEFYALPQSPQIFKQILMMSGFDRYFQVVRCFRDENFRADRQPEFTQIDCEMSFVTREDIVETFSAMFRHIIKEVKGVDVGEIPVMTHAEALKNYGSDKPDLRFDMKLTYLDNLLKGTDFPPFANTLADGGTVVGFAAPGAAEYSRKQLDKLTDFVKEPNRGMKGLVWVKWNNDGTVKSAVDKFFDESALKQWLEAAGAKQGDLLLVLAGDTKKAQAAAGDLRLEMAKQLDLRDRNVFKPLWVIDFPLLEWNEDTQTHTFAHHPFTSPKTKNPADLDNDPENITADCYDFVLNGNELASGSIRIHDRKMQEKVFEILRMDAKEAEENFGFLLRALEYGCPPHGGIAFGMDRLCAILSGTDSIRDVIAFPKNNAGRDLMIDAPAPISQEQWEELELIQKKKKE